MHLLYKKDAFNTKVPNELWHEYYFQQQFDIFKYEKQLQQKQL